MEVKIFDCSISKYFYKSQRILKRLKLRASGVFLYLAYKTIYIRYFIMSTINKLLFYIYKTIEMKILYFALRDVMK